MVFKKVLKGFGRLMLTTGLLCGVGLFLCGSDVWAASATRSSTGDIVVELSVTPRSVTQVEFYDSSSNLVGSAVSGSDVTLDAQKVTISNSKVPGGSVSVKVIYPEGEETITIIGVTAATYSRPANGDLVITITDSKDISAVSNVEFFTSADGNTGSIGALSAADITPDLSGKKVTIDRSKVAALLQTSVAQSFKISYTGGSNPCTATTAFTANIAKVTAAYKSDSYGAKTITPKYQIIYGGLTTTAANPAEAYVFKGDTYNVKSDVSATLYHENNMDNGDPAETSYDCLPHWDSSASTTWKNPGSEWTFTEGTGHSVNDKKFVYLPKVKSLAFDSADAPIVVVNNSAASFAARFKVNAEAEDGDPYSAAVIVKNMLAANVPSSSIKNIAAGMTYGPDSSVSGSNFKISGTLSNTGIAGMADITISGDGKTTPTTKKLFVYYKKPTIDVDSPTPLTALKGSSVGYGLTINPTIPDSTVYADILTKVKLSANNASMSTSSKYTANSYFDASTSSGNLVLTGKAVTSTNQSAYIQSNDARLGASDTDRIVKQFTVKVTEAAATIDADYTKKAINSSDRNYITYNDKKYKLDIAQLVIDNLRDGSNKSIKSSYKVSQVSDIEVDDSTTNIVDDRYWQPTSTTTGKTFTCNVAGTAITGTVMAYPMPTATYNSDRTLSLKIPTKVSTAYSDSSTNLRKSKGFKLSLEDSSGNTLYSYDDSKYKSVLSSSDEQTVSYTVSASDVENLVTSAASNGKFSSDTTSVKFKIVPMGYKQSSSSDDTIKADGDRIYAKTDTTSVYKVSVTGNYFNSTSTYGLNGQTVTLTATPNSGYTFKQWSDGNTSNPRSITVSSSGTRTYQAVAGEKTANGTNGSGSGTGTDNSSLYDDVPKTAESNSAIWLIIFMVFAVMGTTYALYLQLRAASSKNDK